MNVINLTGRMAETPELKMSTSNKAVCSFRIAVPRPRIKDTTDFFTCVAWENKAEFVSRYFRKGQRIEISGILTTRQYKTKDDKKHTLYEILCDTVDFGESKKESEVAGQQPLASASISTDDFTELSSDDDLPF